MPITIDEKNKVFYLRTPNTSYIMAVTNGGTVLRHLHWGRRVEKIDSLTDCTDAIVSPQSVMDADFNDTISTETYLLECGVDGGCDLREPAFSAKCDGFSALVLPKFEGYELIKGKPEIPGLPHTYAESDNDAETLKITLKDESGVKIDLYYSVFAEYDAIIRWARVTNETGKTVRLDRAMSASVDFDDRDFELLHLDGAWMRERHIQRTPIMYGKQSVDSVRGASSHLENPFIALVRPHTTECEGECFGFNLCYSGNFSAGVHLASNSGLLRAFIGINPQRFEWRLENGEEFVTPETVMVYSDGGLEKMSQTYHDLYRNKLIRGKFKNQPRPVLINNWEGTYFDFNEKKIVNIAKSAKEMGVELMVLDDGWFGKRNDDNCSLGDWFENKEKLPNGIDGLAKKVTALGMKFGLWFEPEMVSPDSELFRKHPDWHIHIPNRKASLGRHQLILDFSNKDVCDYIINSVGAILDKADISYVKWDMNRSMAELGSSTLPKERMGELTHRYILGVYRVMEVLTSKFPDVLFEGCSSGGGRFDPGMLYYMPQIWTSDCSEAVERLKIQYGTSVVYPASAMGAHVSAVPNHQVGRSVSLKMRGDVAMMGQFGYELDPIKLSDAEREEIKEQIKFYKEIRDTIHNGTMYRLKSPFESQTMAMNFVNEDKSEAVLFVANVLGEGEPKYNRIRLRGLDKNAIYKDTKTGKEYSGEVLMNIGVRRGFGQDFQSEIIAYKKK